MTEENTDVVEGVSIGVEEVRQLLLLDRPSEEALARERELDRAEARYRKTFTRLLREGSHELGRIEALGERRWRQLTNPARRDLAKLRPELRDLSLRLLQLPLRLLQLPLRHLELTLRLLQLLFQEAHLRHRLGRHRLGLEELILGSFRALDLLS